MRLFAVGLVIAVGCGGGDGNGRPSVGTTQANVCGEVAKVACYNMYSCCSEGEIETRLHVTDPRTQDECVTDMERLCDRSLARIDFSLKNNRVRFDAATMNSCLSAIEAPADTCATLSTMLPWADACMTSAWVGITADGAACNFANECGVDSTCATSGLCTPKPTVGQPCGTGCASGLYCNVTTCAAQLGAGQTCSSTTQCTKGLFCDLAALTPTCTALHDTGQACTGSASCTSGRCNPGTCSGTGGSCFTNAGCFAHCSNNTFSCTLGQDATCGLGTCSTGGTCSLAGACAGTTGTGTCTFPNHCVAGSCDGSVVCADNELTVDYCTGALSALPVPLN